MRIKCLTQIIDRVAKIYTRKFQNAISFSRYETQLISNICTVPRYTSLQT